MRLAHVGVDDEEGAREVSWTALLPVELCEEKLLFRKIGFRSFSDGRTACAIHGSR